MGMGETARTEIADRELASTRERPASRDESHKHNTEVVGWHNPNMPKGDNKSKKEKEKENVARGAKGGGWGKENRTGALGPGPIRGHSTQWGKELQPTEHQPATLHGVMGLMGHF